MTDQEKVEKRKAYRRNYYEKNKEKLCLYSRLYYWKNKQQLNFSKYYKYKKKEAEVKGFVKINEEVTLTFE